MKEKITIEIDKNVLEEFGKIMPNSFSIDEAIEFLIKNKITERIKNKPNLNKDGTITIIKEKPIDGK